MVFLINQPKGKQDKTKSFKRDDIKTGHKSKKKNNGLDYKKKVESFSKKIYL